MTIHKVFVLCSILFTSVCLISCSKKSGKETTPAPEPDIVLSQGWDTISVSPTYIYDLHFGDPMVGYLLGGPIQKTTDGGKTWKPTKSQPEFSGPNCFFLNANTGWVSSRNFIYKTTDGGDSWEKILLLIEGAVAGAPTRIQFLDEHIGYCITESGLIKTNDGGYTWSWAFKNVTGPRVGTGLYILDPLTGWAAGNGGINRVVDGVDAGKTTIDDVAVHAIQFFNANSGLALGFSGKLFKTDDGGKTWNLSMTLDLKNAIDLHFFDKENGYVSGSNGVVKISGEQAEKVVQVKNDAAHIGELHFISNKKGFVGDMRYRRLFRYNAPN
ncbi:hypothetical protein HHL16_04820 [Pseudoflavitalea sp. G-6-1-2]|uniref:WD40/YVTN/BNR-like repeat-containing protein n=1 Tax=Pseudoflavitalea sp. G-6-1-2 TaxID=2728841 RepID=UPI00146E8D8D|nr:YCF48-related protein [Pseudoflavitalea sp. G-6-1-2]NML20181.1 hypothetical protein [Pseudoflavitalea sp. G-6-1-2]